MVYLLALSAAALFGTGSAVQQRVAATAPPGTELRFALLWYLIRQPLWLVGVGTSVVGNLFTGAALGIGGVSLVQPLLVTKLLFALPISARWNGRRMHVREWSGAAAMVTGLAIFLVAGAPGRGDVLSPPVWRWIAVGGSIGTVTAGLVILARWLRPRQEAPVLGAGAGMLYGLQAGLTQTAVRRSLDNGVLAMLLAWPVYAVAVAAVMGTLLAQSAYKLEPLPASYPPLTAVEPLAGIAIGLGVLGGTLRMSPLVIGVQAAALTTMTIGVYVLTSSPLVVGLEEAQRQRKPRGHR